MAGHVGERRPIVAAAVYALVAGGWIVASDLVVGAVLDSDSLVSASLVKGVGFVAVTSVVLFFLLRARERAILAAEAVVRESTDRLRVLERAVEASPAGIAILGPPSGGMVVEYVNPAAAEISGWPREAIVGLPASEIGERLIPGDWTELLAAVAAGEPFERAYDVERPDGSTTPVAITGGAVAGPAGVVDRIVIVGTDIGAERRTETERAKLARAIDQAQEAIVITDAAAVIEYVNPAFERVSGYRRDDLVGRNPRVLKSGAQSPAYYRAMWDTLARGEAWRGILVNRARDGTLYEEDSTISPVRDAAGATVAYVGVKRDLSTERALEAGLQEELRDRALVRDAIARMKSGATPEETASSIVESLASVGDVDGAILYHVRSVGTEVVPLAVALPPELAVHVGEALEPAMATFLRQRVIEGSAGAVRIDEGQFDPRLRLADAHGFTAVGSPIDHRGSPIALLVAMARPPEPGTWVGRWERTLDEVGAHASSILGPQLAARDDVDHARSVIHRILDGHAYAPVFQPIHELATRAVVGYEALTRFRDRVRPDLRFAEAAGVGLGLELELACARAALESAHALRDDVWVSLNASPALVMSGELVPLLRAEDRAFVVEVTEHLPIDDYATLRAAIATLGPRVRTAVDDAGAGYASLRHVVELRPEFVKLDIGLIRGIHVDPARQALVAGMVYFARETGSTLIAEGIETDAEAATIARLGVTLGQGFLLGRPASLGRRRPSERS